MPEDGIPSEVKTFIQEHISSVEQLEALLLLYRNPSREWTADDISKELYISLESAEHRLKDFHARGFASVREGTKPLYRYAGSGPLDHTIHGLAGCYEQRRVRVINLIFSKPIDHIRSFADAFKFKKDEE